MQGLITENIANLYKIKVGNKIYDAVARGKFKKDNIIPVVGDFVDIQIIDEDDNKVVINNIKERKVYIKRPKMANIDKLILVVSSKNPKPDLLMLDKQLVYAEYLGIDACIVLNKIDLDINRDFYKVYEVYKKIGYNVVKTEANNSLGIDELIHELKGNINAFAGNSGVGKSSLINAIFSEELTKEGEISIRNRRGKNTTTVVKLYEIEDGTYIADTPGFSTFSIEEVQSNELAMYFKEFKDEIKKCEFVGCTHIKEENCAIKKAIKQGRISEDRYERFCKIYEELKIKEERKKW